MSVVPAILPQRLTVGSLRADIYSQILLRIFRGDYSTGTRLKVQQVSEQFGVSSTPVREAFVELSGLGVVEMFPNRGVVVAPFGSREIAEIYHIRRLLEVEAARCASQQADLSKIEHLLKTTEKLQQAEQNDRWIQDCLDIDRQAHEIIAEVSGISRLQLELNRYGRLVHIIRNLLKREEHYLDEILAEHVAFLRPILDRNPEAAGLAMAQHLDATCRRVLAGIFERAPERGPLS